MHTLTLKLCPLCPKQPQLMHPSSPAVQERQKPMGPTKNLPSSSPLCSFSQSSWLNFQVFEGQRSVCGQQPFIYIVAQPFECHTSDPKEKETNKGELSLMQSLLSAFGFDPDFVPECQILYHSSHLKCLLASKSFQFQWDLLLSQNDMFLHKTDILSIAAIQLNILKKHDQFIVQ